MTEDQLVNKEVYLNLSMIMMPDILSEQAFVDYWETRINVIDEDDVEVFEYWAVSNWLAEQLIENNEIVGELQNLRIWERTTFGQGIDQDGVIKDIIKKLNS